VVQARLARGDIVTATLVLVLELMMCVTLVTTSA